MAKIAAPKLSKMSKPGAVAGPGTEQLVSFESG